MIEGKTKAMDILRRKNARKKPIDSMMYFQVVNRSREDEKILALFFFRNPKKLEFHSSLGVKRWQDLG